MALTRAGKKDLPVVGIGTRPSGTKDAAEVVAGTPAQNVVETHLDKSSTSNFRLHDKPAVVAQLGAPLLPNAARPVAKDVHGGVIVEDDFKARLTPFPTPGAYNVWFPSPTMDSLRLSDTRAFPGGAFVAFDTEAEAQRLVSQRGVGVVINQEGAVGPLQAWGGAAEFRDRSFV